MSHELINILSLKNKPINIKSITDKSDELTDRMRIEFKNGYQLSIIRGYVSYGYKSGLFEIAPFNKNGDMDGNLFDDNDKGDDVLGYCNKEKVEYYVNKIGNL